MTAGHRGRSTERTPTITGTENGAHASAAARALSAIDALRRLRQGDAEEQRRTLDYLEQALDEERSPGQKLFAHPEE
jgi:hypothetical protein